MQNVVIHLEIVINEKQMTVGRAQICTFLFISCMWRCSSMIWIISGSSEPPGHCFCQQYLCKNFSKVIPQEKEITALVLRTLSLKSHMPAVGLTMLPWEWSYPDEYFWYRSLPADICGLYSLSRQTLLNSDLQNQAEGERKNDTEWTLLLYFLLRRRILFPVSNMTNSGWKMTSRRTADQLEWNNISKSYSSLFL